MSEHKYGDHKLHKMNIKKLAEALEKEGVTLLELDCKKPEPKRNPDVLEISVVDELGVDSNAAGATRKEVTYVIPGGGKPIQPSGNQPGQKAPPANRNQASN